MSDPRGHLKVSRKFFESDPWWNEARARTRAEAWLDFLHLASWRTRVVQTSSGPVSLSRGEVLASYRFLATRWHWTVKAVRSWFATCQSWSRVKAQRETQAGTVHLVINYDYYQSGGTAEDIPEGIDAGTPEAHLGHTAGTKKKQLSSKAVQTYSPAFEDAFARYPKRPNNNKGRAWQAWTARINAGETEASMAAGTDAYAAFVVAMETPPEYVKQAATFYGPNRYFLDDYTPIRKAPKPGAMTRADHLRKMGLYVPEAMQH